MIELLENLQFWHWWAFAGALVVVETLLPSGILYGVAIAAASMGGAVAADWEFATTWQVQLEGFVGLAVVFGWVGRKLRNRILAREPTIILTPQPLKPPRDAKPPLNLENAALPAPKPAAPKPVAKPAPAKPTPSSPPEPDFVGGVYTIWSPITGGTGSIKIKGTDYALVGPDLPAGTRIKVTDVKNKILKVQPVDK